MLPLKGIRILDWTIWQFGPTATSWLGDMGAEVIKIEQREVGDPARALLRTAGLNIELPGKRNALFEYYNRNKKSIAIDLKADGGKEIIYELVAQSDVFVQNFRRGVSVKYGLDYKTLKQINPKLIYANASGYGPKGPESGEPAYDYLAQARSGFMTMGIEPDLPPQRIAGAIADQAAAMMLSYGILAALLARERLGVAQEIDVSLLGSMIALQAAYVVGVGAVGEDFPKQGRKAAPNPLWNHYRCGDGKWIALGLLQSDRYWESFCRAIGKEGLIDHPDFVDFQNREQNRRALIKILDDTFLGRSAGQWVAHLKSQGDFLCCVINDIPDALRDPQALLNEYIVEQAFPGLDKIMSVGFPVHFSDTEVRRPGLSPELGQHTEEVLMEVAGYSQTDVVALKKQKVI